MKQFTPIIHCLTDMSDWHYFRMEYNKVEDSLSIIWTHSFLDEKISQKHLEFLYRAVNPILSEITMTNAIVQEMNTS